jgi:hypothetical protein
MISTKKEELDIRNKERLFKMDFENLQCEPEFKKFVNYLRDGCYNMTTEVEYILKKSIDDNEAPLKYDDYEQQIEVYSWYVLSDCILRQLQKRGEVVLNDYFWGRQCTGQSIEMDEIMIEIFKEWWLEK